MDRPDIDHILVVGAGAAGLMAARELGRAGRRVTILEARSRCGGRIYPLLAAEFAYPAAGGAEFVHGEAPVTHRLLREAGLSLLPIKGTQWRVERRSFSRGTQGLNGPELHQALRKLEADLPVAEFLREHFAGPRHERLRRSIERMVESYDAADPERASTFALRDEWMNGERRTQARIAGGYGAVIDFLDSECRKTGVSIRLDAAVSAIETTDGGTVVVCANGDAHTCDAVILTVPVPLLKEIVLPPPEREKAAAVAANIGIGNVIKILLGFKTRWWLDQQKDLGDLTFLLSDAKIPVWWTQPADFPVLTGWFAGPKTEAMTHFDERGLIETGLGSLAGIFELDPKELMRKLVTARAINWASDPFARGAYSYATLETREVQSALASSVGRPILFSGEALYRGPEMGTVEAALASGLQTARTILAPR